MKVLWKHVGMRHYHTGWWRGVRAFNEGMPTSNTWLGQVVRVGEEDVEAVSALIDTDRSLTVCELALEIGLSHMTVFRIVKKCLVMQKIASWWVPWDGYDMTPLKLTCSVMVMMVTPSYSTLLRLMKPGPGHMSLLLNPYPMSGITKQNIGASYPYKCRSDCYCCFGIILTHAVPQRQNINVQYFCHFLENNPRPAL